MQKEKEEKKTYAKDDLTDTSAEEQENMAKEAIKNFKPLGKAKLSLEVLFFGNYGIVWIKREPRGFNV